MSKENNSLLADFNYLVSKINFPASFLDAKALTILNTFPERLKTLEKKHIKKTPVAEVQEYSKQ